MKQPTSSLWDSVGGFPHFDPLRGDVEVDVAIIGAGITGLTAAALLTERGLNVIVIEKDRIGSGETGNTTAHLTVAVDARYHYIRRNYSEDDAKRVAGASRAALARIAELIERYAIDCDFRRLPGYLYTEKRKYVAELKNEANAAHQAGLDAEYTDKVPLPFPIRGAVVFANQAQFHPRKYLNALATRAGRIVEQTLVTDIKNGTPCVVETDGGRVTAKAVFQATNVPIAGFTTVHTLIAPYRSYAIAFEAGDDHPDGLFWDTADPYHYTRWQKNFMIVGGEDHRVGEEEDTDACFQRLIDYTAEHFGPQRERYRWSGQIIEPHGGLPLIGGDDNVHISTGYSGQGMTFGTLGAMIVSDLITGAANPWADLFAVSHKRPNVTAREFLTENLHFPTQTPLAKI